MNPGTWPAFLLKPNKPVWYGCVRYYTDSADANGVTLKQLRRGHCPYRIRLTRIQMLQLIERGDLRPFDPIP